MSEQGQKLTDLKSDGICISDGVREGQINWHNEYKRVRNEQIAAESELSSLRAEVERLKQEVADRDRIILGLQDVIGGRTKTIEQIHAELKQKFDGTL